MEKKNQWNTGYWIVALLLLLSLQSYWLRDVLSWILSAVSFFGVWFFLFRRFAEKQGMGGFINIGKSRVKVFVEKNTGVTFAYVAGGMRPRRSWSRSSIS